MSSTVRKTASGAAMTMVEGLDGETDLAVSGSSPPEEVKLGYDIQWQAGKRPILFRRGKHRVAPRFPCPCRPCPEAV